MNDVHTGIVLRTSSAYKRTITLLDENYGKIEALMYVRKSAVSMFHGALISYSLKKKGMKYVLSDVALVDMPRYLAQRHHLFFHHVLELSDFFLPWDECVPPIYELLKVLYTHPISVQTDEAQKSFLYHFFKKLGMCPESTEETVDSWILRCVREHPHAASLQTASYLKIMEGAPTTV